MKKVIFSIFVLLQLNNSFGQTISDSLQIRHFFDEALSRGKAHEDLRSLCKDIGARLSGSPQAALAVEWGKSKMEKYGFDNVVLQPILVPHWERGTKEVAWLHPKEGEFVPLNILALGGSVPTNGLLKGEVVEFRHIDELRKANRKNVEGKIVFLNQAMNEQEITTFKAYGACYTIRSEGAVEAAKLGAKGILIRSLALPQDDFPHTGTMRYDTTVEKIPAAALSTNSANTLSDALSIGKSKVSFELNCRDYPDEPSYNVMGEIKGTEFPDQIITIGGHLDSWDAGEGAHDDGAGVIHCLEALRILKTVKVKPKHTIRVVFFMNEENGNKGGITYATWVKEKGENHIAAIESDRGGFSPRGFECDGSEKQLQLAQSFRQLLLPYGLYHFEKGHGGVDIGPLKASFVGIPLYGFAPDSQRYFDFHHASSDVFENVNKRELELGAGAMAAFVYLLDKNL